MDVRQAAKRANPRHLTHSQKPKKPKDQHEPRLQKRLDNSMDAHFNANEDEMTAWEHAEAERGSASRRRRPEANLAESFMMSTLRFDLYLRKLYLLRTNVCNQAVISRFRAEQLDSCRAKIAKAQIQSLE